jgi:uncharacterized membrane-anchored protein YhcB (DUF1043 family)
VNLIKFEGHPGRKYFPDAIAKQDQTKRMNKTLLTLLVGIGIGILIAPAKGSETWKKMIDGLNDLKDKLEEEADDLVDKAKDLAN